MARSLSAACALMAILLPAVGPARAGDAPAASRVEPAPTPEAPSVEVALERARAALSEERWAAALVAAEAALREDPSAVEALLLKALAYEGRGELGRAESLLVAYQEVAAGRAVGKAANAALDRVRAAARETVGEAEEEVDAGAEGGEVAEVDLQVRSSLRPEEVEALTQRLSQAVEEGRCRAALADARSLVDSMFESPAAWALVGDARRCVGDRLGAVDAYRRARALGSADPGVLIVLRGIEASFGELRVKVTVDRAPEVPRVVLRIGDEARAPDFRRGGETVFRDIDSPEPMTLVVSGLGLREEVRALDPLAPGERRRIELKTTYVGVGELRVGSHEPSDCRVQIRGPRGPVVGQGGVVEVTAGWVPVLIHNEFGYLNHRVRVPAGELVELDPLPLVPSTLTVVGLPVGSLVRAYVDGALEGTFAEQEIRVRREGATVDKDTGVLISPPLKMGPLMGGSGGVFLEHPRLGDAAADVSLQPGRVNATTFVWQEMAGVEEVRAEFREWKVGQEGRTSRRAGPWLPPAVIGLGAAVAAGVLLASGLEWGRPSLHGASAATGIASGVAFGIAIGVGAAAPRHEPWSAWKPEGF